MTVHAEDTNGKTETSDTKSRLSVAVEEAPDTVADEEIPKKSFFERLPRPIRWIINNWADSDPRYALSSFYNWSGEMRNTTSFEWVDLDMPQGIEMSMHSRISNRIGPSFGWRFLTLGTTIDFSTIGKGSDQRKDEFTFSINSNLFSIDLIRRRTGGDFILDKLNYTDPVYGTLNIKDVLQNNEIGDYTKNSLTGVNINYIVNHRKYSNPAAFSSSSIQLISAGSPIVGLGYTRQKVETESATIFGLLGLSMLQDDNGNYLVDENRYNDLEQLYDVNPAQYERELTDILRTGWRNLQGTEGNTVRNFLTNRIPSTTIIDDWHIQLGYAYNVVFSRRLMLGLSAIVSPGLKRVRSDNENTYLYAGADVFSNIIQQVEGRQVSPDDFRYYFRDTHFNVNTFLKTSLTFNYNRWRAGIMAQLSNYFYTNKGMKVNNGFGSLSAYVSYSFGRKSEFRYNGEFRKEYINAALTKQQIIEMNDTMPASNIDLGRHYADSLGKTPAYHTDVIGISVAGCDLVRGPEGKYGWYEIEDGYVTPRQDTEGRLRSGLTLDVDEDGCFRVEAGHDSNFRTGNWWKTQLKLNQTPNQWYPEMLHYALRGKLTLYLRGRIFNSKKPVKLEISNFCVNHGKDSRNFYQVGAKSFTSRSPYSVEGETRINSRLFRIFIEQKSRGKHTQMYVSLVDQANADWMSKLDDSRRVSSLSIPGTHDAGTASLHESAVVNSVRTQFFSVPAQLYDGVRAFDIRLKENLKYGHTFECRESFDSTMVEWDRFLADHPGELIVAMIGSDGGGRWSNEMTRNFRRLVEKYPHRFVEHFDARTTLGEVRGKVLVIRRQDSCPFGKLLKFTDNAVFDYDCFRVEDVYKERKTWKKAKIVEKNIREAFENENPDKWFITFNSVAWSPRRHTPYAYAWGGKAKNIRKPLNKTLRETLDLKYYNDFGIVFLDFYNDHGEQPQLVQTIIGSNFHQDEK
ncbi:MAG: DUF4421 family protein [Prevotella sp.]|nr:DUF4421 family protein [Prevotella sp.]